MSAASNTRSKTPSGAKGLKLDDSGRKPLEGDTFGRSGPSLPVAVAAAPTVKPAQSRARSLAPSRTSAENVEQARDQQGVERPPPRKRQRMQSMPPSASSTHVPAFSPLAEEPSLLAPQSSSGPSGMASSWELSTSEDRLTLSPVPAPVRARAGSPVVEDVEDEEVSRRRTAKTLSPQSPSILVAESEWQAEQDNKAAKQERTERLERMRQRRNQTPAPRAPVVSEDDSDEDGDSVPNASAQRAPVQKPLFDPDLQGSDSDSDGRPSVPSVGRKHTLEEMLGQRTSASPPPTSSTGPSKPPASRPSSRSSSRAPPGAQTKASRRPAQSPARAPSDKSPRHGKAPAAGAESEPLPKGLKEATETINAIVAPLTDILGEEETESSGATLAGDAPKPSELDYNQILGDPDDDDLEECDYDGADQMDDDKDKPKTGFRRGKISNEHMELILTAVRLFDETLTDIARESGKSLSYIYRLAMPHLKISRKPNLFNLFVKRWCFQNKMQPGESFPQLRERFVAAYREDVLPKTEAEKQRLRAELLKWNETYEKKDAETVKKEGNLYKIMLQARLEFEVLAQYYYRFYDIATFGWCVSIAPGDIHATQANSTFASTKAAGKWMDSMGASIPKAMDEFAAVVKVHKAAEISMSDWSKEKQDKVVPRGGDDVRERAKAFLRHLQKQATGHAQTTVQWKAFQGVLARKQKVVMNWPEGLALPVGTKYAFMGSMEKLKSFVNLVFEIMRDECPPERRIYVRDMNKDELENYDERRITAAWRRTPIWRDTTGKPLLYVGDALNATGADDEGDAEEAPEPSEHAKMLEQRVLERKFREQQKEEKRLAKAEKEREKRLKKEAKELEKPKKTVKSARKARDPNDPQVRRAQLMKKQSATVGALPKVKPSQPKPDYIDAVDGNVSASTSTNHKRGRSSSHSSSSTRSSRSQSRSRSPSSSHNDDDDDGPARPPSRSFEPSSSAFTGLPAAGVPSASSSAHPPFLALRNRQQLGGGEAVPGPTRPFVPREITPARSESSAPSSLAGAVDLSLCGPSTSSVASRQRPAPARAHVVESSLAGALGTSFGDTVAPSVPASHGLPRRDPVVSASRARAPPSSTDTSWDQYTAAPALHAPAAASTGAYALPSANSAYAAPPARQPQRVAPHPPPPPGRPSVARVPAPNQRVPPPHVSHGVHSTHPRQPVAGPSRHGARPPRPGPYPPPSISRPPPPSHAPTTLDSTVDLLREEIFSMRQQMAAQFKQQTPSSHSRAPYQAPLLAPAIAHAASSSYGPGYGQTAYGETAYGETVHGADDYATQGYSAHADSAQGVGEPVYGAVEYDEQTYDAAAYDGQTYGTQSYGEAAFGDQQGVQEDYVDGAVSYGGTGYSEQALSENGYADATVGLYGQDTYDAPVNGQHDATGTYTSYAWGQ
ncbi:hypothetical protein EXIGLDRAFT_699687 [Exidia glandulosa HHB12029]|uniref:Uncharacterized protein n=1 Tax=Exidia glandulosa HHB12029 TaxID=1314781 RepID=A0A165DSH4_EXIGL|nr:hypothetical protein EXIGLDRAFT_699687 [Exidia glandulosa HHB12029]